MTFFDNKEKHLLPSEQDTIFLSILGNCEREADYFTPDTYKEVIFDNFNEYINFYTTRKKSLLHTIIEAYIRKSHVVDLELFIDWILNHKHLNVNAQDSLGNTPLHLIAFSRFGKGYLSYTPKINKLEERLINKGAKTEIVNQGGFTPYQIEQMIVKNIIIKKRAPKLNKLKEQTLEERNCLLKKRFEEAHQIEDLNKIITDFYLLIKKKDRIVLATREIRKIKEKVIRMAIHEPEDYFDYDFYQKNKIKNI